VDDDARCVALPLLQHGDAFGTHKQFVMPLIVVNGGTHKQFVIPVIVVNGGTDAGHIECRVLAFRPLPNVARNGSTSIGAQYSRPRHNTRPRDGVGAHNVDERMVKLHSLVVRLSRRDDLAALIHDSVLRTLDGVGRGVLTQQFVEVGSRGIEAALGVVLVGLGGVEAGLGGVLVGLGGVEAAQGVVVGVARMLRSCGGGSVVDSHGSVGRLVLSRRLDDKCVITLRNDDTHCFCLTVVAAPAAIAGTLAGFELAAARFLQIDD
jgi:hypothetical protein